jgi:hypothetical protein
MIGDTDLKISKLYGMLPATVDGTCEGRTPADNQTVGNVFVIGPDKKIRLIIVYPMTTGRHAAGLWRAASNLRRFRLDGKRRGEGETRSPAGLRGPPPDRTLTSLYQPIDDNSAIRHRRYPTCATRPKFELQSLIGGCRLRIATHGSVLGSIDLTRWYYLLDDFWTKRDLGGGRMSGAHRYPSEGS